MVAAAVVGGAVIGGGASMLAAGEQADAAESAAGIQAMAQREATAEQRRQYDLSREDLAPYRETGTNALTELSALYGMGREGVLPQDQIDAAYERFTKSPSYEFRFDEGLRAKDRSAAARGGLRGGGYGRELERYGQGLASTEFGTYADRLASLAGMGQGATTSTATLGAQSAANIGNTLMTGATNQGNALMAGGTARASGYAGTANAVNSGIQNYMFYDAYKNPPAS